MFNKIGFYLPGSKIHSPISVIYIEEEDRMHVSAWIAGFNAGSSAIRVRLIEVTGYPHNQSIIKIEHAAYLDPSLVRTRT